MPEMEANLVVGICLVFSLIDSSANGVQGFGLINKKLRTHLLEDVAHKGNVITGLHQVIRGKHADPVSPEGSWFLFNDNDHKIKKKNRKRKCKKCNTIPYPKVGPKGPQGPRGYQGPPGPTGGILSLQDIEGYITNYLTELANNNKTLNWSQTYTRSRPSNQWVPVIFTARSVQTSVVPAHKSSIITDMTVTFGAGQLRRGVAIREGRFSVTKSGIYQVGAAIVLKKKEKQETGKQSVSLSLCVDHCNNDKRLRWAGSVSSSPSTATLSGHIRLLRGQSIKIMVSNPSSSVVEISPGSTFSAAFIGT